MHIQTFTSCDMDKNNIKLTDITLSFISSDIFAIFWMSTEEVPNVTLY